MEPDISQYVDPVYRYFYLRVGNREDAESLTRETLITASRHLAQYRSAPSTKEWVFTIARDVLEEHWRRCYPSAAPLPGDDAMEDVSGHGASSMPPSKSAGAITAMLERLPDDLRRILELRFLHGYSVDQTARELDATPETVRQMQRRALAQARHMMQ